MFIRGELNRLPIGNTDIQLPFHGKIPALGFDATLGLSGNATFSGIPLRNWHVKKDTYGQSKNLMNSMPTTKQSDNTSSHFGRQFPKVFKSGEISWYHTTFKWSDVPSKYEWNGPLNLRLEGVSSKATIYLNGRLIGRWLSDNTWMRRGSWAEGLRGPWSNGDEDETPIEPAMLRRGTNLLAILMEDCGTLGDPGHISNVTLVVSKNENKFVKRNGDGDILSSYSQKVIISAL
jgi:hypothetical protein